MNRLLRLRSSVVLALLVTFALPASARTCAPDEAGQRLTFIRQHLDASAGWTQAWRWSWVGVWGAATVGQAALIPLVNDPGSDIDNAWGAGFSAVAALYPIVLPPAVLAENRRVQALSTSEDAVCDSVPVAEEALRLSAADQASAIALPAHLINFGFNAAYTLVLGLGYKRWDSGLIGGGIGFALGELMIFSQPRHLVEDLADYEAGRFGKSASRSRFPLRPVAMAPWAGPTGGGVHAAFVF